MSKLICPNCGHTEGGTMRELGAAGIALAAIAGVGFLVGGPVGAAVGGGFAGKMAQRAVNQTSKAAGKAVCYRCPNCNTVMKEG